MRFVSYRNRQRIRTLLIALGIALAVLLVAAVCLVIYLQRYIVYTRDGARLDFGSRPGASDSDTTGEAVLQNPEFQIEEDSTLPDVTVEVDTEPEGESPTGMARVSGVYVTAEMLADPDALTAALDALEGQTAVMLDLKSIYGNYYYHTSIPDAELSSAVDADAVDQLIANLAARNDRYLIARIPAFRDSAYALANQDCGLPLESGALWMDSESCYWLDPAKDLTVSHLESIVLELQTLGFDEVVFTDFYFPDSTNIAYEGDRSAVVLDAAKRLSENLAGESITLSLATTDPALAAYAQRVYLSGTSGSEVQSLTSSFASVYDTLAEHVVFVTDSRDTRFADYGLLQPALQTDTAES